MIAPASPARAPRRARREKTTWRNQWQGAICEISEGHAEQKPLGHASGTCHKPLHPRAPVRTYALPADMGHDTTATRVPTLLD
eukprot:1568798-Pyramimonas_sp.AAC.1